MISDTFNMHISRVFVNKLKGSIINGVRASYKGKKRVRALYNTLRLICFDRESAISIRRLHIQNPCNKIKISGKSFLNHEYGTLL